MPLDLDPIVVLNLVLSSAILVLGVMLYDKKKEKLALYVGAGFGLFAISHALTLLGYGGVQPLIIPLRAIGYVSVFIGLGVSTLQRGRAEAPASA